MVKIFILAAALTLPYPPGYKPHRPPAYSPKMAEMKREQAKTIARIAPAAPLITVTGFSITTNAVNIMAGTASMAWTNGTGPYQIWQSPTLSGPWSTAGNTTLAKGKTVSLFENQFWRLQAQAPSVLTLSSNTQPRLTWTVPDTDMADSLTPFFIEKSTDGGTNWSAIAASDAGLAAGHFNTTTRAANDATTPPVRYRITEVTANGVTVPYNGPSLSGNASGTVIRAVGFNSTLASVGKVIKVLPSGDYVMAGYFKGTQNMGGTDLVSSPGSYSLYIARFHAGGAHVWSKSYGGAGDVTANGIDVDSSGNVFLCGIFTGTGNFGGSNFVCTSTGAWHAKYNSSGNHLWSHGYVIADLSRFCEFTGCVLDSSQNMFCIGYFQGNGCSFGGAPIVVNQQFTQSVLAKYDKDGNFLWNITFPAVVFGSVNQGLGLTIDSTDNVYIGGNFYYSIDLAYNNPGNDGSHTIYTSNLTYKQAYVGKFDNNGIHQWSFRRGGDTPNTTPGPGTHANPPPTASQCFYLSLDGQGNLYCLFDVSGLCDLGAGVNMTTGQLDNVGVARYRASDGAYVSGTSWQQKCVITGDSGAMSWMVLDKNSNPVIAFNFNGNAQTGVVLPDGTELHSSAYSGVVLKLTASNGSVLWYVQIDGPKSDGVNGISTDPNSGNCLAVGSFNDTTRFGQSGVTLTAPNSFGNSYVIEIMP